MILFFSLQKWNKINSEKSEILKNCCDYVAGERERETRIEQKSPKI
jgi:hypothetical protein